MQGEPVRGDHVLAPGEVFRIAHAQLAFVQDLSKAFPDTSTDELPSASNGEDETVDSSGQHGRMMTSPGAFPARTDDHHAPPQQDKVPEEGRGLDTELEEKQVAETFRVWAGRPRNCVSWLSSWLIRSTTHASPTLALDGLFVGTNIDAGAVYLLPRDFDGTPTGEICRSSLRARKTIRSTIVCRDFWRPRCCAKAKPYWLAMSKTTARLAAVTARAKFMPPA